MAGGFGGGAGSSSGASGQILISIVLDDSTFNSKIAGVNSKIGTLGNTASTATTKMQGLGGPMQIVATKAKDITPGLATMGTNLGAVGNNAGTATPKVTGIGGAFSKLAGNTSGVSRGLSSVLTVFQNLTGIDVSWAIVALNAVSKLNRGVFISMKNFLSFGKNAATMGQGVSGAVTPLSNMGGALSTVNTNSAGAAKGLSGIGKLK